MVFILCLCIVAMWLAFSEHKRLPGFSKCRVV